MRPKSDSGPKLGELLATRGRIDRELLLRALRHQRAAGGRLGTCLLELDAVAEEDLLHVLSDQLKVPHLDADDLRAIPAEVIRLIPAKVAAKRGAVPVRASGTQLTVAMLDPTDLAALDELAFVSGRRIRPHAAAELRIQEALGRYYGIDVPPRFVKLLDRINRARFLWKEEAAPSAPEAPQFAGAPRATEAAVPMRPAPMPVAPAPVPVVPPPVPAAPPPVPAEPPPAVVAPPPPAPPPAPAASFEATERRLLQPAGSDEIAEALVDYLRGHGDVALVLAFRRDRATAWRAHGVDEGARAALAIGLGAPSLASALHEGLPLHRGPLSPLPANAPLAAALGEPIADLVALPLRVRDRVVGAVLAATRARGFEAGLVEDLQRLVLKASGGLELLVLRQKLQQA